MKPSLPLLLPLLLLASGIPRADAVLLDVTWLEKILDFIFEILGRLGIWDSLFDSLCKQFAGSLPNNLLDCQCTGSYTSEKGFGGDFFCRLDTELCVIPGDGRDDEDL